MAVRLSPPLVGDLLAKLVAVPGLDVVIDLSSGAVEAGTDVLVTASAVHGPMPPAVVVLDEGIAPGRATVHTRDGTQEVAVLDLDAVAAVVRDLCDTVG